MVFSQAARLDLDNTVFNGDKTVLYKRNTPTEDLSYGANKNSFEYFEVPAQGSIANLGNHLVRAGLIANGDCRIVLRYEYATDKTGNTISPTLYPKLRDEVALGGLWFRLDTVTPILGEDNLVIAYECVGKPTSNPTDSIFPLSFPILLS